MEKEKNMRFGQANHSQLRTMFLVMYFIVHLVIPVVGYSLNNCTVSYSVKVKCSNIRAIPQGIPSRVTTLDLSGNRISQIGVSNFTGLSNLTRLDLKGNNISIIAAGAFAPLISLQVLILNDNKLTELQEHVFDGLSNLTELRLAHNHMKTIAPHSFYSLINLNVLDLNLNNLHGLGRVGSVLRHLPHLQDLSLTWNNMPTFDSWELSNTSLGLKSLDLSQNPIEAFRITADILPNLTLLNLGHCGKKPGIILDVQNKTFLGRVSTLEIGGAHISWTGIKNLSEVVNSSLTQLRLNDVELHRRLLPWIRIFCTIPSLSTLKLEKNQLKFVPHHMFDFCVHVTELDLAFNRIQNISEDAFRSLRQIKTLNLKNNSLLSVPAAIWNLPMLQELDLANNSINALDCKDFTNLTGLRSLHLSDNRISALKGCIFKDLIALQYLEVHRNPISDLGDAFRNNLANLRLLKMSKNQLTTISRGEFKGLQHLEELWLQDGQIENLEDGSFTGLTNLVKLNLANNKLRETQLKEKVFNDLKQLKTLNLNNNHIRYLEETPLRLPPFSQLSSLKELLMSGQHRSKKARLPANFLQGLSNLTVFSGRNTQLLSVHVNTFNHTPRLTDLDLSSNDLRDVPADLFSPIPLLEKLSLSMNNLRSLDFLRGVKLKRLRFLQVRKNAFSVIGEEEMRSLPALTYLDMQYNSFTCDCDNAWFVWWVETDPQTQVHDAHNFECNYPSHLKGTKLLDMDVRSCSVNVSLICFVSSSCAALLLLLGSFVYHFLRWQLVYAYYLFLALLYDNRVRRGDKRGRPHQYDAFVSYNVHDEPWVLEELLPKLEGEQGWKLCLHHRDFQPGKPIIENITDAIYGSRKTICVISRRYLESEWCSREVQVASFRLFDEQKDVLILVFVEEIPARQLSPYYSMRRLLKQRSYLSWPRAGREHRGVFWEKLRMALGAGDTPTPADAQGDHINLVGLARS